MLTVPVFRLETNYKFLTTAVAQRLNTLLRRKTLEVLGSNPAGCRAFILLNPICRVSLIQVHLRGATHLIFLLTSG